ncbi:MAG: DUF3667 domain-containing protein [Pannonibacter sp.]
MTAVRTPESPRSPLFPKAKFTLVDHFDAPVCRNCSAGLTGPHCSACGQKRVRRLGLPDVSSLAWDNLRWFEGDLVRAAVRVSLMPGRVAREYVAGARKKNIHPFKIFITGVALLLLTISQTNYLSTNNSTMSKALELVQSYSKWSFSLGIPAILIATMLSFWRAGFNSVEHLVLATYTHFAIILLSALSLTPLLIWSGPEMVKAHRALVSPWMTWIEAAVVAVAAIQFFGVQRLRDYWQPFVTAGLFIVAKKALVYLYALAVIRIVLAQLR